MAVSVVIPAYNAGPYIGETLASVLGQTRTDWEIIVVDDCSTDNTAEVVHTFADARIRYVRQPENLRVLAARRRGVELARHPRVMLLDADDRLRPDALEHLEAALDAAPEAVCAYGRHIRIDRTGVPLTPPGGIKALLRRLKTPEPTPQGWIARAFLERNFLVTGGLAVCRRDALCDSHCLETGALAAEDWAAWTLLATHGPFVHVDRVTLEYRIVPSGMSMTGSIGLDNVFWTFDTVFADPRIRALAPEPQLRRLHARRRANAMMFSATLLTNSGRWRAGLAQVLHAMRTDPPQAPGYAIRFLSVLAAHLLNRRPPPLPPPPTALPPVAAA